jgi:hypothetical protein
VPDVPAGKLAIAELSRREPGLNVGALEARAGFDGIIVEPRSVADPRR